MIANVGSGPHPVDEDELQAYVDGLLDARRRSEVEAYLAAHPEEVERVEAYRLQNIGLHALFDRPFDEEEGPASAPIGRLRRDLHATVARQRLWRKVAASLVLVLGVGAVGWWWGAGLDAPPWDRRSTVALRTTIGPEAPRLRDPPRPADAAPEVEVAQAGLAGWLSQRVAGGRPEWPDLRPFGLSLSGERMAVTANGLAVVLVYEGGAGHRLALHIDLNGDELPIMTPPVRGEEVALYWRSGPLILGLIGAMERKELLRIAEVVTDQIAAVGPEPASPAGDDRLLSVQSDPTSASEAITQAAGDSSESPADAPNVAQEAGAQVVSEPLSGQTEAIGPAGDDGQSPPTAERPSAEGEQGERTEPETQKPFSGLPPPRLQYASQQGRSEAA